MIMAKPKFTRILSIDGGGIRGIIPGQILVKIEEKLQAKKEGARIADYFDLFVGTSTGGILTCAYLCPHPDNTTRPKFTAEGVVNLYLEHGETIFKLPIWRRIKTFFGIRDEKFSAKSLETTLDRYFGDVKLSQLLKPCVVTSYDIERRHGHFFSQHEAKRNKGWDFLVKDVARATSAAPTYFECAKILSEESVSSTLIDGGVFVNNPALCGYAEARELFDISAKDMFILSLGTGFVKKPYPYKKAKGWGSVGWIRPVIDIMMSGAAEVIDYQLNQIYQAIKKPEQYIRINYELPELKVNSDMDDARKKNRDALAELGRDISVQMDSDLDNIVNMLVA
jgi:patatin-like phospholipase/acyl hydrolase